MVKAKANCIGTNANALKLVRAFDTDRVVFGSDKHLAEYIASRTGKRVIAVLPNGYCPIRVNFYPVVVQELLRIYRGAKLIAHPECSYKIRRLANFVGSTSQMMRYVTSSNCRIFLVGIVYRMFMGNTDKAFIPASTNAIYSDMKKINLEKILKSLRDRVYMVLVDNEITVRVRKAIENTFSLFGMEAPWRRYLLNVFSGL
ncbi:MAG: quinolinate synthase NadA [Ignisphaera sp.]